MFWNYKKDKRPSWIQTHGVDICTSRSYPLHYAVRYHFIKETHSIIILDFTVDFDSKYIYMIYHIPIKNKPFSALCDINRKIAYPCDINRNGVIYREYLCCVILYFSGKFIRDVKYRPVAICEQ